MNLIPPHMHSSKSKLKFIIFRQSGFDKCNAGALSARLGDIPTLKSSQDDPGYNLLLVMVTIRLEAYLFLLYLRM